MTTEQMAAVTDVELAAQLFVEAAGQLKRHMGMAKKAGKMPPGPVRRGLMTDYFSAITQAAVAGALLAQKYEAWCAANNRPVDLAAEVKKVKV